MQKYISIVVFLFISTLAFSQSEKQLLEKVIVSAKDLNGIMPIRNILLKYPDILQYIPSDVPIKEKYRISSAFGYRYHPIDKVVKFHSGIDMATTYASVVYASASGVVIFTGTTQGYGNMIIIKHKYGFTTLYGHLTKIYTKTNSVVMRGQPIGFAGSTGKSTGDHLHFEIRKNNKPINPTPNNI